MTLLQRDKPMTIEAFLAFTDDRPDHERWELIDGEPILNPSPSYNHQMMVGNLIAALRAHQNVESSWVSLPGIGVKVSQTSMPVPDVLMRPRLHISGHFCDDMIVAFEVLSPSSRSMDLKWKRQAYGRLPSLQHYVVIHQDDVGVRRFDRETGWTERSFRSPEDTLDLPAVGVSVALAAIYLDTGL